MKTVEPFQKDPTASDRIRALAAVKSAIRQLYEPAQEGRYLIMDDGSPLSILTAWRHFRTICYATIHDDRTGWQPLRIAVNDTGEVIRCRETEAAIPPKNAPLS